MANYEHLSMLKRGVEAWNAWRLENPDAVPDLTKANLANIDLYFAVNLSGADLREADLTDARLNGINLRKANLVKATLKRANLSKARLENANLLNADLSETNLHRADVSYADMRGANLTRSIFEVVSAEHTKLHGAVLKDITVTDPIPPNLYILNTSLLALATADGLEDVHPESQAFVADYVYKAFRHAHECASWYAPGIFDKAVENLTALQLLFRDKELPPELVDVVKLINVELISYLKKHPEELHKIEWRGFEELIGELLSSFGWTVQLTQPTKDNGYDIFAIYKDASGVKHSWIIECKKWSPERVVGVDIARALYAVKTDLRVGGAMLATTSHFTKGVKDFKSSRYDFNIKDYNAIIEWLNVYRPSPDGKLYIKDNRIIVPNNKREPNNAKIIQA